MNKLLNNLLGMYKQAKLNKKAEEKESAKKDYTEQYAKVKEIMKEYGYGLSDGGYIYLISKEQPKDEGFQVKFKGDRLRVELDGKLKYSGYGPEAIEDFLKGMFYAKKLSSKAKAVRKQAEEKLYVAKLYDSKGLKNDNLGKSKSVEELKDLLRDFLFEKRKNRETNSYNNSFYLGDKIVIEDYYTGEPIETIKVSDLLSTYGKDYWKPFMNTEATKKQAENKEIVVTYEGTNGKEYIVKAPNGLYFNEYVDTDTQHSRGAGPFETLEKAKEMFKKHRPSAKEIVVTKKKAVLQESENGLGYVLPNGSVVYPRDEEYLQSELKGDKELLEKTKSEIVRLEKEMEEIKKEYPEVDLSKYPDSILFKLDRELKLKETIELSIETIEDILNAFKNKKMGKQATIKHENGVYNVYSESGKCLGKGYKTKEEAEKRLKQVEYFKHKKASRMDWEFPGYETEPIDSRIEWLYTHNVNYNKTQYDYIWKLRETLKGEHVDFDEKGEKVYLNKDDIEDILYYLKHHNKNYRGDQYWIIDDLKVEDFIKNLKSSKRASLKQVVISKMAKIKK